MLDFTEQTLNAVYTVPQPNGKRVPSVANEHRGGGITGGIRYVMLPKDMKFTHLQLPLQNLKALLPTSTPPLRV